MVLSRYIIHNDHSNSLSDNTDTDTYRLQSGIDIGYQISALRN